MPAPELTDPDQIALRDRFMIYGEQPRWELLPTLPVCAVRNPAGGLMAIATGGAAETECHVATDGFDSDTDLEAWLTRGADFARSLPPK